MFWRFVEIPRTFRAVEMLIITSLTLEFSLSVIYLPGINLVDQVSLSLIKELHLSVKHIHLVLLNELFRFKLNLASWNPQTPLR